MSKGEDIVPAVIGVVDYTPIVIVRLDIDLK